MLIASAVVLLASVWQAASQGQVSICGPQFRVGHASTVRGQATACLAIVCIRSGLQLSRLRGMRLQGKDAKVQIELAMPKHTFAPALSLRTRRIMQERGLRDPAASPLRQVRMLLLLQLVPAVHLAGGSTLGAPLVHA